MCMLYVRLMNYYYFEDVVIVIHELANHPLSHYNMSAKSKLLFLISVYIQYIIIIFDLIKNDYFNNLIRFSFKLGNIRLKIWVDHN